MKFCFKVFWVGFLFSHSLAQASLYCQGFLETDTDRKELPLNKTKTSGTDSYEYSDDSQMIYMSADYTENADWILLSIQVGNTGTAVDAAFRMLQGKRTAELIFSQYQPKALWRINCTQ